MSILESMLLGLLQGLTEFLPVSSSGHLALAETLLKLKASEYISFDLLLHLATLLAVCIYFRVRLFALGKAGFSLFTMNRANPDCRAEYPLIGALILSTVMTGVIGVFFKDSLESVRDSLPGVGLCFLLTGVLLLATRFSNPRVEESKREFPINPWIFALILGIMQGIAILPGVSRSGATICTALLLGMPTVMAVEYSFLLSIPAILAASLLEFHKAEWLVGLLPAMSGFLTALISGLLFLGLLVWIVRGRRMFLFAFYTIPLGIFVLLLYILGYTS